MKAIIGTKLGMTQIFQEDGTVTPVTLIRAEPCTVTMLRTQERDGYTAIQMGSGSKSKKRIALAQQGAWKDLGLFRAVREFRTKAVEDGLTAGSTVDVSAFEVGDRVDVVGTSKGRGFQGVVKRHGFRGHKETRGTKDAVRMPGSIGAGGPQHVFKGRRMPGHMGNVRVTVKNLEVAQVRADEHVLVLKGAVPGSRNSLVMVRAAV